MEKQIAVVLSYNFDPDVEVVLFPDEEQAKQYVRQRYDVCMAEERSENPDRLLEERCDCYEDWAEIVWSNEDTEWDENKYDYMMWTIVTVSEPRK